MLLLGPLFAHSVHSEHTEEEHLYVLLFCFSQFSLYYFYIFLVFTNFFRLFGNNGYTGTRVHGYMGQNETGPGCDQSATAGYYSVDRDTVNKKQ